jgi:DNA-binding MarR family transcriptional regulator
MDRTSLTAALKPLERRGLVQITPDSRDRRSRLVQITSEGVALLEAAVPTWRETHAALEAALDGDAPAGLRAGLRDIPARAAAVSQMDE